MEFYKLMKTKRITKSSIPLIMSYAGKFYRGSDIIDQFMIHLQSCFVKSSTVISTNFEIATQQIDSIYQQNYTDEHLHLWSEFTNSVTVSQVTQAIHELDDKKDPGPMRITSQFIKFNV